MAYPDTGPLLDEHLDELQLIIAAHARGGRFDPKTARQSYDADPTNLPPDLFYTLGWYDRHSRQLLEAVRWVYGVGRPKLRPPYLTREIIDELERICIAGETNDVLVAGSTLRATSDVINITYMLEWHAEHDAVLLAETRWALSAGWQRKLMPQPLPPDGKLIT